MTWSCWKTRCRSFHPTMRSCFFPPRARPILCCGARCTPLVGAIPIDVMRQANYMVDRDTDRKSPTQAARWLENEIHLK